MNEVVGAIFLLLAVIVFLLAVIAACLLFGSANVLDFGLFLLLGFAGCVVIWLVLCGLVWGWVVLCALPDALLFAVKYISSSFRLYFSSLRSLPLKKPMLGRTVDITSRGASLRVSQLEAAGYRFSHSEGNIWHFTKQKVRDGTGPVASRRKT
jgi:hypothetical protein